MTPQQLRDVGAVDRTLGVHRSPGGPAIAVHAVTPAPPNLSNGAAWEQGEQLAAVLAESLPWQTLLGLRDRLVALTGGAS